MKYRIYVTKTVAHRRIFEVESLCNTSQLEAFIQSQLNRDLEASPELGGEIKLFNENFNVVALPMPEDV